MDSVCPHCSKPDMAVSTVFEKLPPYLVIHIERSESTTINGECIIFKNSTKVIYPIHDLDMKPFVSESLKQTGEEFMYDLLAVVVHTGSNREGHYSAICRDNVSREDKWFQYNDLKVEEITEGDIQNELASILVYSRKGQNLPTAKDLIPMINEWIVQRNSTSTTPKV